MKRICNDKKRYTECVEIEGMHWKQVEDAARLDCRCILPLGSTEQHAFLSLSTVTILASKLGNEIGEAERIPVFPCIPYGLVPSFQNFPGTVSLKASTYFGLIRDILEAIHESGFRRIFIVNGHGGNIPAKVVVQEFLNCHRETRVIWHDWWIAPETWKAVEAIDPVASHASWMENFPWTRLRGVRMPETQKQMVDFHAMRQLPAPLVKDILGDGNFGGYYQKSDDEMLRIWKVAVEEALQHLKTGWTD